MAKTLTTKDPSRKGARILPITYVQYRLQKTDLSQETKTVPSRTNNQNENVVKDK
jgi:hypothetical protein